MTATVKDLGRFQVVDQNGKEFEIHETSLLPPNGYNSPAPRVIEWRFALVDGTPVQKLDCQRFSLFDESTLKAAGKVDRAAVRRISDFLRERLAALSNPRSLGEVLNVSKLTKFQKYIVGDY